MRTAVVVWLCAVLGVWFAGGDLSVPPEPLAINVLIITMSVSAVVAFMGRTK